MDLTSAQILQFILYPLFMWNMYTTSKTASKLDTLEKMTEDFKETEIKVVGLERDQANIFEAIGGIKHDLHDIRNFLMNYKGGET